MSTYIFDFDGTLGDSMSYFSGAVREILTRHGIPCSEEIIKDVTPLGLKGTAQYLNERFKLPYTTDTLVLALDELLYSDYEKRILLKEHAADFLIALKQAGHSVNILSAGQFRFFSVALKRCGVFELFDHTWSCDDFGMMKSDPQIYLAAVERAGGKLEDSFFFDDNVEAIRAAVKAGIYTTGVYDKASEGYTDEIKMLANRFIYSWDEMLL